MTPPTSAPAPAQSNQPAVLQPQAAVPLQAKAYKAPSDAQPSAKPVAVPLSPKSTKDTPKTKKAKKDKEKRASTAPGSDIKSSLPDGIQITWRKPPPPQEVAEAMKFLQPQKKPEPTPDASPVGPPVENLVSCPFCRGQFVDVSEHMDHCPVITGSTA
jgi:hypothetical protein